jgi:hypothetical protein
LLKRDITYENPFTGSQVTETHYFHISKTDLVEMELEEHGNTYVKDGEELTGMQAKLQRIVDSEDGKAIMAEFKDIIRRAYGRKEGERFRKSQEIWDDFAASEAFSQLLWELCTQAEAASDFVNGIVPTNLDQIAEEVRQQAERVTKGREAQAAAKAAGGHPSDPAATPVEAAAPPETATPGDGQLSPGTAQVMDAMSDAAPRQQEIANATPENPVTLTEAEVREIDSEVFRSGIADGRYKVSN